ncbi:cell division protein ZapC [Testudinibacter sp. TR-2022]|nr:cell division protein ZapC [Pasteurellaceae bacterium Phil11]TNH22381.1 cell division protein ZapC [Testudinibacter sp. TR-2022]TNH29005.1 cell division protein ZapC [Testudinibacter sp. TR-2022]
MQMNGFFYWEYDKVQDCLMLCSEATRRKIPTALKREVLNYSALGRNDCEAGDFLFYNQVIELLEYSNLIDPEQHEFIAYSATGARQFLLPSQAKSWFFEFAATALAVDHNSTPIPAIVQTRVKQTGQSINLLLLNCDEQVADCLLLDPALNLAGLRRQFGQPLRIFNNRLQALPLEMSLAIFQQQSA